MKKYELIEKYLVNFLREEVFKTGLKNAVLGLSGGIDSAVVAVLAKRAFGKNLKAVLLPSSTSSKSSIDDAKELCDKFEINFETVFIGDFVDTYFKNETNKNNLRIGNFSARIRMNILYDLSAKYNSLVIGTSNKSELMLGYGTLFGDLASAINPIGDMYKSEVFEFAEFLKIPQSIIYKPPSADLWSGQSDEEELGFSYNQIDEALRAYVDERLNKEEMLKRGFDKKLCELIIDRIYKNQFKRKLPVIAKLGYRTIGHDFLYPRDIKL